ncbi:MAG: DALR anticodon-binding domain-containing protein, partial [Myxococcota bacterium]|nr:DALR anticodon-binding domain-containing protein [Myxococcota bacterium]
ALEPHRIATYLHELVGAFHSYYTRNRQHGRVVDDNDPQMSSARLLLCNALAHTLRSGLAVLGVSAPERMDSVKESKA